ncbi:MAG: DinB family protein [Candidatus Limnocylindrales bacterium]
MARMSPEEADAYRKPVLDALGADDPFEVQEAEFEAWQRMVEAAGEDLRERPAHEEWSVVELVGHIVDSELVSSTRYRWMLAEKEPVLPGFDQEAWTAQFNHRSDDPELLLTLFGALRLANLDLWERTEVEERDRFGIHAERGPESFELLFRLQAGHGRVHLKQAGEALAAVRSRRSPA